MGPLKLLIFQGTPFCNIDCKYCYLPNRSDRSRLAPETVDKTLQKVVREGLLGPELEVLWHCGEPLTVPIAVYRKYFSIVDSHLNGRTRYSLALQTNGTLLTDEWCVFLKEWNVNIGVSLDGPRDLHNLNRCDRSGRGTFDATMRGVELLRRHDLPFYVICVLHRASLPRWSDLHDFFLNNGIEKVCFNVEEIEGINANSSLAGQSFVAQAEAFFGSYFNLLEKTSSHWLREYDHSLRALCAKEVTNSMVTPYDMLTVDHLGNYSTFSPEVLNAKLPNGKIARLGHVDDGTTTFELALELSADWVAEISRGVERCRSTCDYFDMCGGGSPSNKLAECGTFDATETIYCRLGTIAPIRAMAGHLQRRLAAEMTNSSS